MILFGKMMNANKNLKYLNNKNNNNNKLNNKNKVITLKKMFKYKKRFNMTQLQRFFLILIILYSFLYYGHFFILLITLFDQMLNFRFYQTKLTIKLSNSFKKALVQLPCILCSEFLIVLVSTYYPFYFVFAIISFGISVELDALKIRIGILGVFNKFIKSALREQQLYSSRTCGLNIN